MKAVEDELKNIHERIRYNDKRRVIAEGARNYKLCEEIMEEVGDLQKLRELQTEMKELKRKDGKSQ